MREYMSTDMALADQEDWQTWSRDRAEFEDDAMAELTNMTRGEIRRNVAQAHQDGDVSSRYTAASILWVLEREKYRINHPELIVRAAGRLMVNSMADDESSFYDGLREKTIRLDEQVAGEIVYSVALEGNTGYWPCGVSCEELGAAVAALAGIEWVAENLNPNQAYPTSWWTTSSTRR